MLIHLHKQATTTPKVRASIQASDDAGTALAERFGGAEDQKTIQWIVFPTNPKTVAKWRKRASIKDLGTGPKEPRSTVLSEAEEAAIVAFRRHTLLPLDDCLYALQPSMPNLTRSALHRCLQR